MDHQGSKNKIMGFALMIGFVILGLINLAGITYFVATVLLSTMPNGPWISIITFIVLIANGLALGLQAAYEVRRMAAQQGRRTLPAGSWLQLNMAHVLLLAATLCYFGWACKLLFTCSEHLERFASVAACVVLAAEGLVLVCVHVRPVRAVGPVDGHQHEPRPTHT